MATRGSIPYFVEVKKDIEKLKNVPYPAIALVFALFVSPDDKSNVHRWITEQVGSPIGVKSLSQFEHALLNGFGPPDVRVVHDGPGTGGLASIQLCAFGFNNPAASRLAN